MSESNWRCAGAEALGSSPSTTARRRATSSGPAWSRSPRGRRGQLGAAGDRARRRRRRARRRAARSHGASNGDRCAARRRACAARRAARSRRRPPRTKNPPTSASSTPSRAHHASSGIGRRSRTTRTWVRSSAYSATWSVVAAPPPRASRWRVRCRAGRGRECVGRSGGHVEREVRQVQAGSCVNRRSLASPRRTCRWQWLCTTTTIRPSISRRAGAGGSAGRARSGCRWPWTP